MIGVADIGNVGESRASVREVGRGWYDVVSAESAVRGGRI